VLYVPLRMSIAVPHLLPSADGAFERWRGAGELRPERVGSPVEMGRARAVVGLPATCCRSFGLRLPRVAESELADVIEAQLEKRGLLGAGAEGSYEAYEVAETAGGMVIWSVDVLRGEVPAELALVSAEGFVASARLTPPPPGHLAIYAERGRLVGSVSHGGQLVHAQVLGPLEMEVEEVARNVGFLLAGLHYRGLIGAGEVKRLLAWGTLPPGVVSSCGTALGLEVAREDRPRPQVPPRSGVGGLVPPAVLAARARARAIKRGIFYAVSGAILYVCGAVVASATVAAKEAELAELRTRVEQTTAPAAAMRETSERWRALEPAVSPKRIPVMIFAAVTDSMPETGLQLDRFELRTTEVRLQGRARDAQVAYQFLEDLKERASLDRYRWDMREAPRVGENNIATFEIRAGLP
jgi:hypothetical protein